MAKTLHVVDDVLKKVRYFDMFGKKNKFLIGQVKYENRSCDFDNLEAVE